MAAKVLLECLPTQLRYERASLADEFNALGPWREAISRYQKLDYDSEGVSNLLYGCTEWETPAEPIEEDWRQIEGWIDANEDAIALLDQGISRGRLQLPSQERRSLEEKSIVTMQELRDFSRLLSLRRIAASKRGDAAATVAEAVRQLRMSALILRGEGSVIDMLMGTSLLRIALDSVCKAAEKYKLSSTARQELESSIVSPSEVIEAIWSANRIDICEYGLSTLSLIPETNDATDLTNSLLQLFYQSGEYIKSVAEEVWEETPPSDKVLQRREQQRRQQLESLLDGHPRLFDLQATTSLMGEITLANLECLGQPDAPAPASRWRIAEWFRRRWRPTVDELLGDAWPYALQPNFFFEAFGDDEIARSKRAEIVKNYSEYGSGEFPAPNLAMPTDRQLKQCRERLRQVDNPVGRMTAHTLAATAMPQSLIDTIQADLLAAKQALHVEAA